MESETRAQVDDPRRTATSVAGVAAIKGCTPIHENMRNFVTIGYIVLIGDTARGIIWPTLYTLLLSLGGSSSTLGWCVATFSIGRVVGSPIFGWLSARLGPALTLQMSLLVFAFGAAIYALGDDSLPMIFLSQAVMGLGTSTLGVCRGFVADKSPTKERTQRLAQLTALQYAGFTVTPILGSIITAIRGPGETEFGWLSSSQFTIPGYVLFVLALLGIALLQYVFDDVKSDAIARSADPAAGPLTAASPVHTHTSSSPSAATPASLYRVGSLTATGRDVETDSGSLESATQKIVVTDKQLTLRKRSSHFCSQSAADSAVEDDKADTYKPVVASSPTADTSDEATTAGVAAGIWSPPLIAHGPAVEDLTDVTSTGKTGDRSLVAMLLFLNILTKGGMSVHETLGTQVAVMLGSTAATVGTVAAVFGAFGVISLLSMAMLCKRFKDIQLIGWSLTALSGCAVIIALCTSGGSRRNKAALVFFMLSTLVVYSTAYPIGHTAVLGYFSKVVGRNKGSQSVMLSWFGSAGSLARIVFPIISGVMAGGLGAWSAFVLLSMLEVLGVIGLSLLALRRRIQ